MNVRIHITQRKDEKKRKMNTMSLSLCVHLQKKNKNRKIKRSTFFSSSFFLLQFTIWFVPVNCNRASNMYNIIHKSLWLAHVITHKKTTFCCLFAFFSIIWLQVYYFFFLTILIAWCVQWFIAILQSYEIFGSVGFLVRGLFIALKCCAHKYITIWFLATVTSAKVNTRIHVLFFLCSIRNVLKWNGQNG